jgi:hypothetical protein
VQDVNDFAVALFCLFIYNIYNMILL